MKNKECRIIVSSLKSMGAKSCVTTVAISLNEIIADVERFIWVCVQLRQETRAIIIHCVVYCIQRVLLHNSAKSQKHPHSYTYIFILKTCFIFAHFPWFVFILKLVKESVKHWDNQIVHFLELTRKISLHAGMYKELTQYKHFHMQLTDVVQSSGFFSGVPVNNYMKLV